jgi:hypothetical protein
MGLYLTGHKMTLFVGYMTMEEGGEPVALVPSLVSVWKCISLRNNLKGQVE